MANKVFQSGFTLCTLHSNFLVKERNENVFLIVFPDRIAVFIDMLYIKWKNNKKDWMMMLFTYRMNN